MLVPQNIGTNVGQFWDDFPIIFLIETWTYLIFQKNLGFFEFFTLQNPR